MRDEVEALTFFALLAGGLAALAVVWALLALAHSPSDARTIEFSCDPAAAPYVTAECQETP